MTSPELPPEVIALVHGPVGTMAHVEMLLALRAAEPGTCSIDQIAAAAHLSTAAGAREILSELETASLVAAGGGDLWRYAPRGSALRTGVDLLAAMYHQRPVTLVRALYERPVRPLHRTR
ncbi:hypothetical protein J421_6116 (plasmid) [Gemmatirosa kalamazoonensis]|uniref:HTH iclR-type domain-containing protein n=1 Tax=Gemmatirosa kalamazoonensis TaxID=861299 RepID=W0RSH8_9BACT|nr:hypothetical protein [Gemmatirosa kalamazoonensis]AHG93651.1 hypothetical protein J421_6116 [Gemmatirosa kalamazoonensis]